MKTLNLIDLDKSGIKYKISRFPDGQQNITINSTVEVNGEGREIFKDPITDDGTKKSKKGLLRVVQHEQLEVLDQQTWSGEGASLLTTVFKDGKLVKQTSLDDIRKRLTIN
jgi:nicotinic acid phosphoribosyltransferase